jgi:hypothetical protein
MRCPVCGTEHESADEKCPSCGLRKDHSPDEIPVFRKLFTLAPEQRSAYFERENLILSECGKDFMRFNNLIRGLQQEFGITADI